MAKTDKSDNTIKLKIETELYIKLDNLISRFEDATKTFDQEQKRLFTKLDQIHPQSN